MRFHEHISRSLTKAITFRVFIIIADTLVLYLLIRRLDIIIGIITVSTLIHTLLYFAHERIWNNIHWGKMHRK